MSYRTTGTKVCNRCNVEKDLSEFYKNHRFPGGYNQRCKQRCIEATKAYQEAHLVKLCPGCERWGKWKEDRCHRCIPRAKSLTLRQRGLNALGPWCVHCGETTLSLLTFGHINGNGAEHRRLCGGHNQSLADWDRRGWPRDEVEVQCWNRNCGGWCRQVNQQENAA